MATGVVLVEQRRIGLRSPRCERGALPLSYSPRVGKCVCTRVRAQLRVDAVVGLEPTIFEVWARCSSHLSYTARWVATCEGKFEAKCEV